MLPLGCLDTERNVFGSIVELGKHGFMLMSTEQFSGLPSPRGYKEEHAPQRYAERGEQLNHVVQVSDVIPGNRGIDLNRQACFAAPSHSVECLPVGAPYTSKSIVQFGGRAIQAQGQPPQADVL